MPVDFLCEKKNTMAEIIFIALVGLLIAFWFSPFEVTTEEEDEILFL